MKFNRKLWMQLHLYLSLFFLPAALIYAITGALFMFNINHHTGAVVTKIELESMPSQKDAQALMLEKFKEHNLRIPEDTELRMQRGNFSMGNIQYGASIFNDQRENKIIMQVTERNLYNILMFMHKSVGKKFEIGDMKFMIFDFLAIGFGISMIIFYLSGLIMTSFCKGKRASSFITLGIGFVITIIAIYTGVFGF